MNQPIPAGHQRDLQGTGRGVFFQAADSVAAIVAVEDDLTVGDLQVVVGGVRSAGCRSLRSFTVRLQCRGFPLLTRRSLLAAFFADEDHRFSGRLWIELVTTDADHGALVDDRHGDAAAERLAAIALVEPDRLKTLAGLPPRHG